VVVYYLNIFRTGFGPSETDAVLVVDSNAVLSEAITFQCFKSVSWRNSQILKPGCDLKLPEFPASNGLETGEPLDRLAARKSSRVLALE